MTTRATAGTTAGNGRGGEVSGQRSGRPTFEIAGGCYGATMSTIEAAALFGCTPERLQSERGRGTLPVEPLQLGRRLRWPTALVGSALGLEVVTVAGEAV